MYLVHRYVTLNYQPMKSPIEKNFSSSNYEADQLAKRLSSFKHGNAILIATSPKASMLARQISDELDVPYHNDHCQSIAHPGHVNESIGSLTANEIILHDQAASVPQDYIQHQVQLLQHHLATQKKDTHTHFKGKTVIVLRETLRHEDEILAVLHAFRREQIAAIYVATPIIYRNALIRLQSMVDGVVYTQLQHQNSVLKKGR